MEILAIGHWCARVGKSARIDGAVVARERPAPMLLHLLTLADEGGKFWAAKFG